MIRNFKEATPHIAEQVFLAESAEIVGDVSIGKDSSIWYNATLRGDEAPIRVGERTSIQDNCVLHVDADVPCVVGSDVTVGHGAIIHAATVEDCCLIGMGAVVLDQAVIGRGSVVAAGCVVSPRTQIPPYSLVMGVPGKVVKTLSPDSEADRKAHAAHYAALKDQYR